jgi:chemotaxis protein MotB
MDNSTEEKAQQPIIIKKKKGGHAGHHGGAWKVAYADFVTAMMAFFLVMWIVGLSDEIKKNVAAYFRDPIGFSEGRGSDGVLNGSEGPFEDRQSGESIIKDLSRREKEAEVWESLKEVSRKISQKLETTQAFANLKDQIEIELTSDGLRVQLIEATKDKSFFASGSAIMREDGKNILMAISSELANLPYQVVVEGHTDNRTFGVGADYTNWELSADRANTARRVMLAAGMAQERIKEIRGFAANQPRFRDDPSNPANRRIAIIVLNEYASDKYKEVMVSAEDDLQLP